MLVWRDCVEVKTSNIGILLGLILEPILLTYLSAITLKFSVIYADGATFLIDKSNNSLILQINNELPKLNQWLMANSLSLNLDKTSIVVLSA